MSDKARTWLEALKPTTFPNELTESYPDGPIFEGLDVDGTCEFLQRCVAFESRYHINDDEMDGVNLTIEFELGTMRSEQVELSFSLSHPQHEGSISFSLSIVKDKQSSFLVFGDDTFRQMN